MGEEWRKEADERRRCETGGGGRGVINRKWKKRKVTAGMGDVTGGDACRDGRFGKDERREKMTGETGRIPVFLFKKTNQKKQSSKLRLFAEAYSS